MAVSTLRAKVWLLYLKRMRGVRGSLCANVTREVCSYLEDLLVVQITPAFLRFFRCPTSKWGERVPLRTPINVNEDSSWIILEDERLFCSGGVRSK